MNKWFKRKFHVYQSSQQVVLRDVNCGGTGGGPRDNQGLKKLSQQWQ